ncbi:Hypothetical protein Minf_2238 [Methylacidiphilum infernorum V4]|uniref:Uncharacterized protein n=1 Tax=Methylacidiphilum infernorum (isolate V4) TaxID=481448 RepID=B3DZV7_METI4|nr:Hypothetical protein Minf_2238 [Methylacidiphilum infernorum V4]
MGMGRKIPRNLRDMSIFPNRKADEALSIDSSTMGTKAKLTHTALSQKKRAVNKKDP